MKKDRRMVGIFYVVVASVAFGIMPIITKLAYSDGANTTTTLAFRFTFATIILFIYIKTHKLSLELTKNQAILVVLLAIMGYGACSGFLFLSYNYISVGMASMILYSYPAVVTLLSMIFYKEALNVKKVLSLVLAIGGILLIVDMSQTTINIYGVFFAALSSLAYSFYVLGVSKKSIKGINSFVMTFYLSFISAIFYFVLGFATNSITLSIRFYGFISILLLALICTLIPLISFLQGVRIIGPSSAAILSTIEPIVGLILGIIILGEPISIKIIIGSLLVVLSAIIIAKP